MDALWLRTRGECGSGMAGSSEDQSLRCSPRPSPSPAQHHSSRGGGQGDSRPGHLVLLDKCLLELPKSHQGHLQDVLHLHGMWTSAVLCCQVPVIQMRAGISFWFRASQLSQVSFGESAGRELAGRSSVYPYTLFKKKISCGKNFLHRVGNLQTLYAPAVHVLANFLLRLPSFPAEMDRRSQASRQPDCCSGRGLGPPATAHADQSVHG